LKRYAFCLAAFYYFAKGRNKMEKNQSREIPKSLKLFQKKAVRHLLTPKSKFDFADVSNKAGIRKLRIKSITRDLKI